MSEKCVTEEPPLIDVGNGQLTACWHHDKVPVSLGATA